MEANTQSSPTTRQPAPRRGWWSRWYFRSVAKCVIFSVVTLFVCFPFPSQLIRNLGHLRNLQGMIEPNAPELAGWDQEVRSRIEKAASSQPTTAPDVVPSSRLAQREVERFVLEKVRYEWDWNLWGSADYMPTVAEMFEKAKEYGGQVKEDCDGRAVMAASLLKRLGYEPTIVTDLRHVWVTTPEGEWMGPGGAKTMVATSQGTRVNWESAAGNFAISLSYGVAVFPFMRELIILITLFVLLLRRWSRPGPAMVGLILLIQGLLFMRLGFLAPQAVSREVSAWPTWVGIGHVAFGILVMVNADLAGKRRDRA